MTCRRRCRLRDYEAPFAHYDGKDGAQVLLISQSGDGDTLFGLYDIMQTLEIVPPEGERRDGAPSRSPGRMPDRLAYRGAAGQRRGQGLHPGLAGRRRGAPRDGAADDAGELQADPGDRPARRGAGPLAAGARPRVGAGGAGTADQRLGLLRQRRRQGADQCRHGRGLRAGDPRRGHRGGGGGERSGAGPCAARAARLGWRRSALAGSAPRCRDCSPRSRSRAFPRAASWARRPPPSARSPTFAGSTDRRRWTGWRWQRGPAMPAGRCSIGRAVSWGCCCRATRAGGSCPRTCISPQMPRPSRAFWARTASIRCLRRPAGRCRPRTSRRSVPT